MYFCTPVLRDLLYFFQTKTYMYQPTSLPTPGRVVGGEESSENHGVHGVQKMGGAIPENVAPLPGAVWLVERRAAKITEYMEYRKW